MTLLRRLRRRRTLAIPLLLGLLLLRAYVPAGFMPQAGNPLQLQLCSAGMPDAFALHHQVTHGQDCPFGHAPAAGPLPDVIAYSTPGPIASPARDPAPSVSVELRVSRSHRARAPPLSTLS